MAYDIFTGLPLDQSVQGATWDDGGIAWATPTHLVGDGANQTKVSGVGSGLFVIANVAAPVDSTGAAVFFTTGTGRTTTIPAMTLAIHGDGSSGSAYGIANAIHVVVGAYSTLSIKVLGGTALNTSNVTLADAQEYCLEVAKTANANSLEYQGHLYLASGGVRGSLVASTPLLTIASVRPNTARMIQLLRGNTSDSGTPNLRINRIETMGAAAVTDTTGPVLESPTATPTGSTTATGTVATNEAGGLLYFLATANATESAATIKASGGSQTVGATGTQTVSITGQTAGTSRYIHYVQTDAAGNDSNVVSSGQITFPAPDSTAPTFAGGSAITPGAITSSSLAGSYPAATDNVAVTGYQYSINSGASWIENGTGLTFSITGLNAATTYPVWIRAKDAAGLYSPPLQLPMTTDAAATSGTITTQPIVNGAGAPIANATGLTVAVLNLATLATVQTFTGETTDSAGVCSVSHSSIVPGTKYAVAIRNATEDLGIDKYMAA